jgi:protein-L-isoaspartate O-methyltransferase
MGVALGELGCDQGRYRLKGQRARALASPDGDSLAAFLQEHVTYHGSVYRHLAERVRGEPPGDYLAETGDLVARSSRILEPFVAAFVHHIVMDLHPEQMLEIGCGSGVYLRYAAEAYTEGRGIALDMQPQVAEQAKKNLAAWGVGDRFQVLAGDIRHPPADIAGPFDLITLYNNIYYFAVEERPTLFEKLFAWLKEGGALALVSPMQGKDVETLNFDVVLQSTLGCTRLPSLNELQAQLRMSGFKQIKTESLMPGATLQGVLAFK